MILNSDIHLINGYVHLHLKDIDYLFAHGYQFHILKVTVVNCRFLKPLDKELLKDLADRNMSIIIYETDMLAGGLGSEILEYYNDIQVKPDIIRIGIKDNYVPQGSIKLLREYEHIDLNTLFDKVIEQLKKYD